MPDIVEWPSRRIIPLTELALEFAWNSRDGGAGINGVTQIVTPLSGLWEMTIAFPLMDETAIRAFRALKARMKGRFCWIRFPITDPTPVSSADAGWSDGSGGGIPFADGAFFSDGMGFASPDITTTVTGVGNLGDEEITLNVSTINDALSLGHFFSIDDYLYLITSVGDLVGASRVFGIAPPLRAAVFGDEVKIGQPTILCRLAEDRSGTLQLVGGSFGESRMSLIEVLERE